MNVNWLVVSDGATGMVIRRGYMLKGFLYDTIKRLTIQAATPYNVIRFVNALLPYRFLCDIFFLFNRGTAYYINNLCIPEITFNWVVLHIPITTVDLNGLGGDFDC